MGSSASPKNYLVYPACILVGAFTVYTLVNSQITLFPDQYPLIIGVLALAYLLYRSLDTKVVGSASSMAAVLSIYTITAIVAFLPTIHTVFRSDDWIILSLFNNLEGMTLASAKDIALFEMFGDIRFQPIAHFLLYARHLIFGSNMLAYHLLNITLHVLTGVAVFKVLSALTRDSKLSFILGLIFITLPSQFDTITWTYHIYIIVSTLFVLLSVCLALKYAGSPKKVFLFTALLLALVSMLLYEPAILGPASLLLIVSGLYLSGSGSITRRDLILTISSVIGVYAFYLALTAYGLSLTRQNHSVSPSDLATLGNMAKAFMVTARNIWESTFIKNIGIPPNVEITDIVYLLTPKGLYTALPALGKIALGLFILSLFRPGRSDRHIAIALGVFAISYIYIISLGRVLTNSVMYVPSQPRYQYFPNALLLITAGIFLWRKFQDKGLRPLISVVIFAMLLWNLQNVVHANNLVAAATRPLDYHYYNIKGFFKSHPSARLLMTFTPETDRKFYLGFDIALDILFKDRLTKFSQKATHIYDGETFTVNRRYGADDFGDDLKDFTVEWLYFRRKNTVQTNPVRIIGPDRTYPKISITPDGLLLVEMLVAGTSTVHTFSQSYPPPKPDSTSPVHVLHMIVEKDDNVLCLAYNGLLMGKMELKTAYRQWNGDGLGLYGEYFSGSGEPINITNLNFMPETAKYGCKDRKKGAIIAQSYPTSKKTDDEIQ